MMEVLCGLIRCVTSRKRGLMNCRVSGSRFPALPLLLVVVSLTLSCVQGGSYHRVKELGSTTSHTVVNTAGDTYTVSGLSSISYEQANRPAVRFSTVSLLSADEMVETWLVPWVLLDRLDDPSKFVEVSDVSDHLSDSDPPGVAVMTLELDYVDALTAVSRKHLLEWALDCNSTPPKILHLRFDGQDVDLSRGTLLTLRYDEKGQVQIEQRIWQGNFVQDELSGSGQPPEFGTGTQQLARSIFDELGY